MSDEIVVRSRRKRIAILIVVVAAFAAIACGVFYFRDALGIAPQLPLLKADATQLKTTVVTPHLEEPILPNKNVLWCSTFQLVWNETCKEAGGDIHLDKEPAMVAGLNKKAASTSDVDANSCILMSGRTDQGIVSNIKSALKKFGNVETPVLKRAEDAAASVQGPAFVAYAYLFRDLPFKDPFIRLKEPLVFSDSQTVCSFGFIDISPKANKAKHQVTIYDYKDDNDFILELQPWDQDERIILAKIPPEANLSETISRVTERINSSLHDFHDSPAHDEPLIVPIMNFDVMREYKELYGSNISTPGPLQGVPIILALQSILFRLDEKGAVLKSEAAVMASATVPSRKPRKYIFDKPFLVMLQRANASRPYFAMWVGNSEMLAAFK